MRRKKYRPMSHTEDMPLKNVLFLLFLGGEEEGDGHKRHQNKLKNNLRRYYTDKCRLIYAERHTGLEIENEWNLKQILSELVMEYFSTDRINAVKRNKENEILLLRRNKS